MTDIDRRSLLIGGGAALLAVTGGSLLSACTGSAPLPSTGPTGPITPGGTLRVGLTGGASSDTFDPGAALTTPDFARANAVFEGLVGSDEAGLPRLHLAEVFETDPAASQWTIRVKSGVSFHDGKPLTADDVLFTLRRIADPQNPMIGAVSIASLDLAAARTLDDRTVRIPTKYPFAILDQILSGGQRNGGANYMIVPVGFDPRRPVGTGPFRFVSFTPNEQTKVDKNLNYWQADRPYLDSVVITEYADETSQVNALTSGQEDAINTLSVGSTAALAAAGKNVVTSDSGGWLPFVMNTASSELSDVRVRQALRLIVDRPQIQRQVFGGRGKLGNDVFAALSPDFDSALPQRQQDIDQAKSLLKSAGRSDLRLELTTAPIAQGATEMAQVFAQQATKAGVTVNVVKTTPTQLFGPNFLTWPLTQDTWFNAQYLPLVALATLPTAPVNETNFTNEKYVALYTQATATTDEARRVELIHEMQRIDYDEGGYIIPTFSPVIDAYNGDVAGIEPTLSGLSMNDFVFTDVGKT